jgi:hypothetical protein
MVPTPPPEGIHDLIAGPKSPDDACRPAKKRKTLDDGLGGSECHCKHCKVGDNHQEAVSDNSTDPKHLSVPLAHPFDGIESFVKMIIDEIHDPLTKRTIFESRWFPDGHVDTTYVATMLESVPGLRELQYVYACTLDEFPFYHGSFYRYLPASLEVLSVTTDTIYGLPWNRYLHPTWICMPILSSDLTCSRTCPPKQLYS